MNSADFLHAGSGEIIFGQSINHALYLWLLITGAPLQLYYFVVITCLGAYLILVSLRVFLIVNIAQTFLILHFSINCMLPIVTLSFPRLLLLYFSISCCYQLFAVLPNLGFTRLNLVNVSVSSESLCNLCFNMVKFGLFLG